MPGDQATNPVLRVVSGELAGRFYEIDGENVVIGRARDCQVVLAAETVSKRHAMIRRDGSEFLLTDLDSRNHTHVNGIYLQPGVPLGLVHGDQVGICEFLLVFHNPVVTLQDDSPTNSTILGTIAINGQTIAPARARPEDVLPAILEIGGAVGTTLNLREVLEKILGSLFTIFPQAERGFVLLPEGEDRTLVPRAVRHRDDEPGRLTLSRTVFAMVMDEGKAILSTSIRDDSRFHTADSLIDANIRTMMCVPLLDSRREVIGMIQIDTRLPSSLFSQDDLDLLAAVAGPISVAVENARLHADLVRLSVMDAGLRHAHEVQMALLPEGRPEVPGYEFWDAYEPAQSVGGDYFDYLMLPPRDGRGPTLAVTLGDVAGKGMPAALLMAKLASEVRMLLLTDSDPVRVVSRLNQQIGDARFPERFVTFLLVLIEIETHAITIINAGHMGPMLRRADGDFETLAEIEAGIPLAIFDDAIYEASNSTLGPGDVLVLYTDGVSEAMDPHGRCFRTDRLRDTILTAGPGPTAVGEAIFRDVRGHAAGCDQSDDIGLVCFGRVADRSHASPPSPSI